MRAGERGPCDVTLPPIEHRDNMIQVLQLVSLHLSIVDAMNVARVNRCLADFLRSRVAQGNRRAQIIQKLFRNPDRFYSFYVEDEYISGYFIRLDGGWWCYDAKRNGMVSLYYPPSSCLLCDKVEIGEIEGSTETRKLIAWHGGEKLKNILRERDARRANS